MDTAARGQEHSARGGSRLGLHEKTRSKKVEVGVSRVSGLELYGGLGFRALGLGFRVIGCFLYRVWGVRARVWGAAIAIPVAL